MKSAVIKYLLLGVSICLAAVCISIFLYIVKTGDRTLSSFTVRMDVLLGDLQEPEFVSKTGKYVDGKTVRAYCEKYGGTYFIRIKTRRNPVSFCVAMKPIKGCFITGDKPNGEFSSYVDSSSYYYVNENAEFKVGTIRDDSGLLLGMLFTEKGSGAVSNAVKAKYSLGANATLNSAKQAYTAALKNTNQSSNDNSLLNTLRSIKDDITETKRKTEDANNTTITSGTANQSEYVQAKKEAEEAESNAQKAWDELMRRCKDATKADTIDHFNITKDSDTSDLDDSTNLEYWNRQFRERGGEQ